MNSWRFNRYLPPQSWRTFQPFWRRGRRYGETTAAFAVRRKVSPDCAL